MVHTLHCLAVRAVRTTVVAGQDVVFLAGQEADCAYLKLTGAVSYLLDGERKEFDESGWMAEVSLRLGCALGIRSFNFNVDGVSGFSGGFITFRGEHPDNV